MCMVVYLPGDPDAPGRLRLLLNFCSFITTLPDSITSTKDIHFGNSLWY